MLWVCGVWWVVFGVVLVVFVGCVVVGLVLFLECVRCMIFYVWVFVPVWVLL